MGENIKNGAMQADAAGGIATIEQGTPLTRLHYFDGKFLRADALTLEQDYHRALVRLANLAGGWGVVHGLGIGLAGNLLSVSPGLAITPAGSTVLLGSAISVEVAKLIAAATASPPAAVAGTPGKAGFADCRPAAGPAAAAPATGYYEITVGPVQGLCGSEEVYGKLCEDACVTDSQSPYWKEGLVLRLRPVTLALAGSSAVPPAAIHLRNRVASAYFAAEPWLTGSLLSAAGLAGSTWCNPATLYNRDEVPIGLLVQEGASTVFVDAWSARRERMDTQARGYWQGRMMMRPWNVFIAQILQFQCQLPSAFDPATPGPGDPGCEEVRALLDSSLHELEQMRRDYEASSRQVLEMLAHTAGGGLEKALQEPLGRLEKLTTRLADAKAGTAPLPSNRLLLGAGFLDLPPAGYLPVLPQRAPVNEQLKRFFGEGVRLFFCTARPDYLPHAVEEVQHMERISLTRGLDDPKNLEEVEVFVPNGQVIDSLGLQDGTHWTVELSPALLAALVGDLGLTPDRPGVDNGRKTAPLHAFLREAAGAAAVTRDYEGVARTSRPDAGGAALTLVAKPRPDTSAASGAGLYADLRIPVDPFAGQEGDQVPLLLELRAASVDANGTPTNGVIVTATGKLDIVAIYQTGDGTAALDAVADITLVLESTSANTRMPLHGRKALTITRKGDARSGQVELWPTQDGPAKAGWRATWQGQPRSVDFGRYAQVATGGQSFDSYLRMTGLAMPLVPEHPLRLAALNTLSALGTATADKAFPPRARRLMFPDAAPAAGELLVRATLDWIMFRRRRKAQCDTSCVATQAPATPLAMKTWHLRLADPAQLEFLKAVLEKDEPDPNHAFDFQVADVLHYLDQQTGPMEAQNQIMDDWRKLSPGNAGVLGRLWTSSAAGQGQPHMERLGRLADLLQPLMTPATDMARLAAAPKVLADPAFDGGMLLVSFSPRLTHHAVFIASVQHQERLLALLQAGSTGAPAFLAKNAAFAAELPFQGETPDVATLKTIAENYAKLKQPEVTTLMLTAVLGKDDPGIAVRDNAVRQALGLGNARMTSFKIPDPDFGTDIPAATVILVGPGVIRVPPAGPGR